MTPAKAASLLGCEAIEAYFVHGPMRCGSIPTGTVTCDDECAVGVHRHHVCPDHGGPALPATGDPRPGGSE